MATQYQTQQVRGIACRKLNAVASRLSAAEVAQTLAELVSMGFVEPVKDGYGITRYRPVRRMPEKMEAHDDFVA